MHSMNDHSVWITINGSHLVAAGCTYGIKGSAINHGWMWIMHYVQYFYVSAVEEE